MAIRYAEGVGLLDSAMTFACRALGAGEDLKGFDVDNKWGRSALERIYSDILGESDNMPGVQVTSCTYSSNAPASWVILCTSDLRQCMHEKRIRLHAHRPVWLHIPQPHSKVTATDQF